MNQPIAPANQPVMGTPPQPASNVMPAVQHAHGHGGRKKASEIIQQYAMQQTGSQEEANRIMGIIADLVNRKISRLVQFGDTVFWCTQHGRGNMDVHIFSLDSPKVLVHRIQQMYQWAKQHGFKQATTTFTDQQQLGVVKASGIPFKMVPTQVNDGKKMVPGFNMVMEIR